MDHGHEDAISGNAIGPAHESGRFDCPGRPHHSERPDVTRLELQAMKAPIAYLLITNIQPAVWRAPVLNGSQVIGRLPECGIVIPGAYLRVSRRHALIGARPHGIWVQDLGSSGGTRLNGLPLHPDCETAAMIGDRLSLAGLELFLVSPEADVMQATATDSAETGSSESTELWKTCVNFLGQQSVVEYSQKLLERLTPAELEVVRWICRGRTSIKEIGDCLFRSPHTIRTQLNSIYKKLGIHSREELLSFVKQCETGWTRPQDGTFTIPKADPRRNLS
jgi:DNA-binding CsgD family transcriptional regulator